MKLKIKHRLFISFITLCFFSLLFTLVSIWMYDKKNKIADQLHLLDNIHLLTMEEYKLQQEFLLYETINPAFYKTGESEKIDEFNRVYSKILALLLVMKENETAKQLLDEKFVGSITIEQNNYFNIFNQVVEETKKKGFKDFGIEGEMRDYAHFLMEIKDLDQINILMLRRHEKDFIIRKEEQYVDQFKSKIEKLKSEIKNSARFSETDKIKLDSIVSGYERSFNKLVASEWALLGKKTGTGLKFQLSQQHNFIIAHIINQKENALIAEKKISFNLLIIAIVSISFIFLLAFLLSYRLAVRLSRPIINLNNYVNRYVDSKFTVIPQLQARNSKDETSELSSNFIRMADEITSYIKYFEEKVEERTVEINNQKIEILYQKSKITQQYEELTLKSEAVENQQRLLMEINKDIMDSIRYAQRIQKAIMPSKSVIKNIISPGFIYFQPRDIVSGDFYFIHSKGNKRFFAIGDATGHGVPGAFLSIIGIHALFKALNEFHLEQPSEILNKVNDLMEEIVSNDIDTIISDGMDIAFCCYDTETKLLQYSGANIPLWIVRENTDDNFEYDNHNDSNDDLEMPTLERHKIIEIKANSQPIGLYYKRIPFLNHEMQMREGDMLYIFSDGYADQFGGPDGKKFKYKRLKNLLLNIQQYHCTQQKKEIKDAFLKWKGNGVQVDDICVLGFKI
ncbi:MAG: SpoIIE family protein phosphatase [Bacteroidota bacterium]